MRAALATLLVAAFWLTTKWSEAAGTVILVAVVSSLFAARPDPVQVGLGLLQGNVAGLALCLPCRPGRPARFARFRLVHLFVVPILVPTALGMANPRHVGVATAFAINFLAFLSPHQAMTYDPGPFFAGSASILVGILLAIGVFIVVLPADPWLAANRIVRAMREDLARLCLHERVPRRSAFESLAYDRINQLMPLLQNAGRKGDAILGGGVAAVTVGLEILRLRSAQQSPAIPSETALSIANFLRGLARELLFRAPGDPQTATVAVARQYAAGISRAKRHADDAADRGLAAHHRRRDRGFSGFFREAIKAQAAAIASAWPRAFSRSASRWIDLTSAGEIALGGLPAQFLQHQPADFLHAGDALAIGDLAPDFQRPQDDGVRWRRQGRRCGTAPAAPRRGRRPAAPSPAVRTAG